MIYGYARISTLKQKLQRQIDNIKKQYPTAVVIDEAYTGTKINRPKWNGLYKMLKEGDTVVFDEVSRMSRNAEEGYKLYEELFNLGANLVFIKEPYLNTDAYRNALGQHIELGVNTGRKAVDKYFSGQEKLMNELLMDLAKEHIELAFKNSEAEVEYLHQRTSEGVRKAIANGKIVGIEKGRTLETKKAKEMKEVIRKHSKDFGGSLLDTEVMKLTRLARNTYYKYKKQIIEELNQ